MKIQIDWTFTLVVSFVFTSIFALIDWIYPQSIFFVGLYLHIAFAPFGFYLATTYTQPSEWTISDHMREVLTPMHYFFIDNTWIHWLLLGLILLGYFFIVRFLKNKFYA